MVNESHGSRNAAASSISILAEAALEFAAQGWSVFPLQPRGKRPNGELAPHGHLNATTDRDVVAGWWQSSPDANIGIACAPNLVVVDVDPRNGGDASLKKLFADAGVDGFNTLTVRTGGGLHYYFQPPGFEIKTSALGDGIDVKSNGYVVAPPSIHPAGPSYCWQNPETPMAPMPPWLREKLRSKQEDRSRPRSTVDAPIAEGARNDTLFRIGSGLRATGLSKEAILAELLEQNRRRCSPPLPEQEVRAIASSASSYAPGAGSVLVSIPLTEVSIDHLNGCAIFSGLLRFESVSRRGGGIQAVIHNGREVRQIRWVCQAELNSFAKSQAVFGAAGVFIPTPRKGDIRVAWEQAARLITLLADGDRIDTGDPVECEAQDWIMRTYAAAGFPSADGEQKMAGFMATLEVYRRDPVAKMAPPCVFVAEERVWVHIPSWRSWLGTPAGLNRHYLVKELRDGLAALGFKPVADVRRGAGGKRYRLDLWCAPIPCWMVGDETQ
jgi:hypothetical protein